MSVETAGAPGCPSCNGEGLVHAWYPEIVKGGPWPCDNCSPGGWMEQKGYARDHYVRRTAGDPRILETVDVSRSPALEVRDVRLTPEARASLGVRPVRVGDWVHDGDGNWRHRPWWKVAINTLLRWLQPRAHWKWVVYTECAADGAPGDPPRVLGYGFGPIEHRDFPEQR